MKKIIYSILLVVCAASMLHAEPIVFATYNIRNANRGDSANGNGWGQRYPYIASMVQFHGFDVFGTQEGKLWQFADLKQAIPDYGYIGVGRDDGKTEGEYSAIFYRIANFEVLDHGNFWLSSSGLLRDSYEIAALRYAPNGTFNGFHPDSKTDSCIDHLFLTDNFKVTKYGILTDTYRSEVKESLEKQQNVNFPKEVSPQKYEARLPSDHFPVMIVVER